MINFGSIGLGLTAKLAVKVPEGLGQPLFMLLAPIGARVEEEKGILLVEVMAHYEKRMANFLRSLEKLLRK